jgi:tetratricopeptide (TPR) repeat protein
MKTALIFLFTLISFFSAKAQLCGNDALNEYEKIHYLIEAAEISCKKGNHKKEKKIATKYLNASRRIESKFKCYSPQGDILLWKSNLHLGEFSDALLNSSSIAAHCTEFKLTGCECMGESFIRTGLVHAASGEDSLAIKEFRKALTICPGYKLLNAFVVLQLADIDKNAGNLIEARYKYNSSLEIVEEFVQENNGVNHDFADLIRGRCYCSLGEIDFLRGNCDEGLPKFLTALRLSQINYDTKTTTECLYNIAAINFLNSHYMEAKGFFHDVIKIASKFGYNKTLINTYNYLGWIFESHGDRKEAIEISNLSLENSKKINYKTGIIDALNLRAFISRNEKRGSLFFSNSKIALGLSKDENYFEGISDACYNLVLHYLKQAHVLKSRIEAKGYIKLGLDAAFSSNYKLGIVDFNNLLGELYLKENKLDSALYFHSQALKISEEASNCGQYKEGLVDAHNGIGNVYRAMHNRDKAANHYYHALIIAQGISYRDGIEYAKMGCEYSSVDIPK